MTIERRALWHRLRWPLRLLAMQLVAALLLLLLAGHVLADHCFEDPLNAQD